MTTPLDSQSALKKRLESLSQEERARLLGKLRGKGSAQEIDPQNPPDVYEPSFQQRNFWILHQTHDFPEVYNAIVAVELEGSINPGALEAALHDVVRRFRIYRTVYREECGRVEAVVRQDITSEFRTDNWTEENGDFMSWACERLTSFALSPFDLSTDCPLRAALFLGRPGQALLGVVFHHIASDGSSYNNFWRVFAESYHAVVQGRTLPMPSWNLQYDSYAACQKAFVSRPEQEANVDFWAEQLRAARPIIEFPFDRQEPRERLSEESEVFHLLPEEVHARVQRLAKDHRTTPNVVYLCAYFAFVARCAEQWDLTVGVPINGRHRVEHEALPGCCVNMLSIRQRIDPQMTFSALLELTRSQMLGALEHAEMPFLKLVEELQLERSGAFGFYNTAFQYRNVIQPLEDLSDCRAKIRFLPRRRSQFAMMLECFPLHGVPRLSLNYDTRKLSKASAQRFLGTYFTLLEYGVRFPETRISELRLMDPETTRAVLAQSQGARTDYPRDCSVQEVFSQVARERRNCTALAGDDGVMTYAELDARSAALADGLSRKGVSRGDRIGICIERSFDLIVAILGVIRTGAAYVALDPEYPPARLAFMVKDARTRLVLSTSQTYSRLRNNGIDTTLVSDLDTSDAPIDRRAGTEPTDPAYLMYTSGSTGTPKGSLIPHRGILRLVLNTNYAEFGPDETFLFLSSPSFDAATFEIWGALLNGATLAIMPPTPPSVREIRQAIRRHDVTTLWLTAGLFHLVVDEDIDALQPLRQLLAGGDVLSVEHVRRCRAELPHLRIINGYGPTENTTFSCCYRVPDQVDFRRSLPIGQPISNSDAFVLDPRGNLCPPGVFGELCVGGDGLSLGYWQRPELNGEAFIPHVLSDCKDERLYKTGDSARLLGDGNIEFLGRKDAQVKIRGFRVELSEIENALLQLPQVRQAVVIASKSTSRQMLIAYVVLQEKSGNAVDLVRTALRESLPSYMCPELWVPMDSLPLTPNGKIDRSLLPEPEHQSAPLQADDYPQNETEQLLLRLWQRLFDQQDISCLHDFFELGGDSLSAMRLVAEIERNTGAKVGIGTLFHAPSIRKLAATIDEQLDQPEGSIPSLVHMAGAGSKPPLFLTHGWGGDVFIFKEFARRLDADRPVYGLQAREKAGVSTRFQSIEDTASHYADELIAAGDGPYLLCGYSLGGMIAFEIGRQLVARERPVRMLFVLDTLPKNLPRWLQLKIRAPHLAARMVHDFKSLNFSRISTGLRRRFRSAKTQAPLPSAAQASTTAHIDHYVHLGNQYTPKPASLPVTLFQSQQNRHDLLSAWSYLSNNNAKVRRLHAPHLDMLKGEPLDLLLQSFRKELQRL